MPNILDVFNGDAYSCINLTRGIEKLPYRPGRLASLFQTVGVDTWTVALEYTAGKISLIPTKKRGSGGTSKQAKEDAKVYPFVVHHLPLDDEVTAAECGVRAFGTTDKIETINSRISTKGQRLRQNHEVTHEYHRIGAIQGIVKDADGSTELVNLFDTFNLSEETVDFELDVDATEVKLKCEAVRRIIEGKLGAQTHSGIVAQCGDGFWDMLVTHPEVKKAFDRWQEGRFLRENQRDNADFAEVLFCGILFQNYRGKIGGVDFIPTDTARFYPTGVPDLFLQHFGPADFVETVGTIGRPFYLKQERQKFDKGIDLHSQSNPCMLCSMPEVLVKGTTEVESSS